MLAYEATRKPAIAALADRAHEMSEAEIAAADVPLAWYKKALLELRAERRGFDLAGLAEFGFREDMAGVMRRFVGPTMFIALDKGEVEVKTGDLVLVCGHGVWIDTLFSRKIDPQLIGLSARVAPMGRSEYMRRCSDKRATLVVQSADEPQRLGVRFTKLS